MAYIDNQLIASACHEAGKEVDREVLRQAINKINASAKKSRDFKALWNPALLEVGVDDMLRQATYRKALARYYLGRKSSRKERRDAMVVVSVSGRRARIEIDEFLSIEFTAMMENGTLKDRNINMEYTAWKEGATRYPVPPETINDAKRVARIAMNKIRRLPKNKRRTK